jgi:AraC-like DNA-binding protein
MVKSIADLQHINYSNIELGFIDLVEELDEERKNAFNTELKIIGLEILDHSDAILIEKVKNIIIEMVHYTDELPRIPFSDYLAEKLHYDYNYLSNLFTKTKGITIQEFMIQHKIERAKEMILYNQNNLTEIAYILNYSSVAHLSNQFKKVTGLTSSQFKAIAKEKSRNNLCDL